MIINFIGFLGILAVALATLCAIALMITGLWEILKDLTIETRGIKNEDSSNRTWKKKTKR
jgi:hypothetical protein